MLFRYWNHSISLSSRDSRLSCDCVSLSLPPTGPAPMPAPQDQCALAPQAGHRHSAHAEKVRQPQAPRRQAHAAQRAAAREEPAPRPPFSFPRWTTNKNRGVPNFAQLFWLRARVASNCCNLPFLEACNRVETKRAISVGVLAWLMSSCARSTRAGR